MVKSGLIRYKNITTMYKSFQKLTIISIGITSVTCLVGASYNYLKTGDISTWSAMWIIVGFILASSEKVDNLFNE